MTVYLLTMSRGLVIGGVLRASLPEGDAYSGTLVGYGGVEPYSWFISSGALPDGVTATTDSDGQFVFSGTTTASGDFTFEVTLQDAEGRSVVKSFSISVLAIPATLLVTGAFTDTPVGSPLAGSPLAITGGTMPYGLSGSPYSGTRPAGVSISVVGTELVATGNTTTETGYSWTERVTSNDGQHYDVVCSMTVTAPNDPYWANVVALLHFDGTNGSTTFTDATGRTWTAHGSAQLSTAQKKFGTASGKFDYVTVDYVDSASSSDFAFGTGDFTIELWFYSDTTGDRRLIDLGTNGIALLCRNSTPRKVGAYTAATGVGGALYAGGVTLENVWQHIALVRSGTTLTLYISGTAVASQTNSANYSSAVIPNIGRYGGGVANNYKGYIDELRITKGVARYTSNFTPPTSPFPNA